MEREFCSFIEHLNYQISVKNDFHKKIPEFKKKLDDIDYKLKLKASMIALKNNYEAKRRRAQYATIVHELDELIKKKKK